ncbi:hypothetical protein L1987_03931 [Smallanthus sonchifolius]|uniref:Uncharacterized protein n=1 Tax=Smallanthus sonchifolius TaxID=185202 RepID=A0ACB9KC12_9ASTR|nr:hypothetical protein L1987_03931 [Smallanthus sonchifolius]
MLETLVISKDSTSCTVKYTTKLSIPSGRDKIGALHSFCFSNWKADSCLSLQSYFFSFWINFRIKTGPLKLIKQIIYSRKRIPVFDCQLVQLPIIDAPSKAEGMNNNTLSDEAKGREAPPVSLKKNVHGEIQALYVGQRSSNECRATHAPSLYICMDPHDPDVCPGLLTLGVLSHLVLLTHLEFPFVSKLPSFDWAIEYRNFIVSIERIGKLPYENEKYGRDCGISTEEVWFLSEFECISKWENGSPDFRPRKSSKWVGLFDLSNN